MTLYSQSLDSYGYIMQCFKSNIELTNDLYDSMEAYIDGDYATGDAKMLETNPLYEITLSGCGIVADLLDGW